MRLVGVGAQAPLLVHLIVLEIALEPFDMAVVLEGEDVGGDAVEEPAVMADDDGAAGEILQRLRTASMKFIAYSVGAALAAIGRFRGLSRSYFNAL